ncbi:hypothetical protein [Kitasatospora sp. A2-31]|uniref:hypothetical protein n=1 Tax=Kitasatospora sp. A2-31 TaxID=2916414 RepID=UPI001EEBAAAF|nr:hypothetical protein [Kitasatospora sp. A2-31]MCG6497083.1 hypothetical protein [Kitasatospora sp. A2-31]
MPEPTEIVFARFPKRDGSTTTGSAWAQATDLASRALLARAGFANDGLSAIFTAEDAGHGDVNQRIRLAEQLLTDAGYPTRVVPPLPIRRIENTFGERDLAYLQSRLVQATAQVHRATTAEDVTTVALAVMDPETGLLERLTALLDTASQRLETLTDQDLLSGSAMAAALQDASAQLTTAGYRIAEAQLERLDETDEQLPAPATPRATAARARTAPPSPPAALTGATPAPLASLAPTSAKASASR